MLRKYKYYLSFHPELNLIFPCSILLPYIWHRSICSCYHLCCCKCSNKKLLRK